MPVDNAPSGASKRPPRFNVGGKLGNAAGTPALTAVRSDELRERRIAKLAAKQPKKKAQSSASYQPRFRSGGVLGSGPVRTDLAGGSAESAPP